MTDFYKKKALALKIIDKMLEEKKPIEHIEFVVLRETGFGKATINKRLKHWKNIEELKGVKKDGG